MGILDTKLIDFEMVIIDKSAKVDKKTGAVRSNVKYGFKDTSGDMTLRELMETMSMAIRDIAVGTYADVLAYEKHNLFNPIFEYELIVYLLLAIGTLVFIFFNTLLLVLLF